MKRVFKFLIVLFLLLLILLLIYYVELKKINVFGTILGTIFGIILHYLINSFIDLFDNKKWKSSERKLRRIGEVKKDTKIRISFAYLYRIIINGKYMLVENSRKSGKYQPVGGVYKFKKEEELYLKKNFCIEYDDRIKIDKISKRDYRLYVKDKFLRKLIRRFEKQIDVRENERDVSREFCEEILKEFKISQKEFGELKYTFESRFIDDVRYNCNYNKHELRIADIYDIILTDEQESLLSELSNNKKIFFASEDDISRLGVNKSKGKNKEIIAEHTWKILNSKSELAYKKFSNKIFIVKLDE